MKKNLAVSTLLIAALAFCGFMFTTTFAAPVAHAQGSKWNNGPRFGNVQFSWQYRMNRSSVAIQAENVGGETITVRVKVTQKELEKDLTFYRIKPGAKKTHVFCASMMDKACDGYGNPSIELLSAD